MNKYNIGASVSYGDIDSLLMPGEYIIWRGKPKANAFVLNSSVHMMPFALIWLLVDGGFIATLIGSGAIGEMLWFVIPFFLIHLFPVWIWLGNVITAGMRWKNTEYAVTDKRIMIRNGLVGYECQNFYYTEITNVTLHIGAIDHLLGVGDIYILSDMYANTGKNAPAILDVESPQEVLSIVQRTVMDMKTDAFYPNAMRPESNPGYNTQYRP